MPSPPWEPTRAGAQRRARSRKRRTVVVVCVLIAVGVGLGAKALAGRLWPGRVRTGSVSAHGATIVRYVVESRFVGQALPQTAAIPPGAGAGRPLLVFLPGRGGDGNESNSNGAFYAALARLGTRAPDVVFPSGGDHSYFHDRASGDWARYVLDEAIPQAVRRLHADPRRIAIGGISMGGYGAFALARLRASQFCAVGGHSAAVWLRGEDSAPGAFDDAADFTRNDLVSLARTHGRAPWGHARLWLDGGTNDPFRLADETLAHDLEIPMHHWSGGHDSAYWHAHYASYLRFYADALTSC